MKEDADGTTSYQTIELVHYNQDLGYIACHYSEWADLVETAFQNRLQSQQSELQLQGHALIILATKGWDRHQSSSFAHSAIDAVCTRFWTSLEN